jgi:hypothetical protein
MLPLAALVEHLSMIKESLRCLIILRSKACYKLFANVTAAFLIVIVMYYVQVCS